MRYRALVLAVSLAGALPLCRGLSPPAQAADPPVDAGLLEFLGSVDSDDEDWHDYLAARHVHKDPVDPPHGDGSASNPGASGDKTPGSSSSSSNGPPAQQSAPSRSPPGSSSGSSGSDSQPQPPGVNQT